MADIVITFEVRLRVMLAHHRVFAVSLYPAIHIVIAAVGHRLRNYHTVVSSNHRLKP